MTSRNRYIEDLAVGENWTTEGVTVSADDIITFGRLYDPQPMHTDPVAAESGPFGGLVASGWHLAALAMRLSVEARIFGDTPIVGAGVDQIRWLKPLRAGDTITLTRTIVDVIPPSSPRSRGTVRTSMLVRNQHGEDVMTMTVVARVPARPVAS